MRPNQVSPYDVIFSKDGITYGYQLAESGGRKMWEVKDISLLPASMITGEASYSSYSPQKQIITQQSDWRGGLQDLMYDSAYNYFRAINTDARFKGKVILSGKNTDTNVSSNLYRKIANSHFEDWDDATTPTSYTVAGTTAKATGDDAYDGDYSVKISKDNGTNGKVSISLAFTATNKSQTFTFTARCKQSGDPTTAKIHVYDGVDTSSSSNVTSATFALTTIEHTMNANATELTIYAECDSNAKYLYTDDWKLSTDSGTLAKCTAMAEFEGSVYYAYGDLLFKHDSPGLGVIMEFPAAITDLCVFQNPSATGGSNPTYERLYIAQGYSAKYWYTDDAATFTISTVANAKYMANIGDAQFLISDSTNTVTSSVNPINSGTAFATSSKVAGAYYEITGLVDHPDVWFVRKEDQVYYLSGASVIPLVEGLDIEKNKDIDYGIYFWLDKLYIPSGENALYEYDITDGTVETLSPVRFAVGDTRYDGKITALASDGLDYLYVAVETVGRCIILAGRWETIAGTTDWRWHPIYDGTDSSEEISQMLVSNAIGKKLYLGSYKVIGVTSPTGYTDAESKWLYEKNAYDDSVDTNAWAYLETAQWSEYLELTVTSTSCNYIRFNAHQVGSYFTIDVDVYYDSAWHDVYSGSDYSSHAWTVKSLGASHDVTKARVRFHTTFVPESDYWTVLYEFDFGSTATYYLKDIYIPISYVDPPSEAGYEFETPGSFFTPWYRTAFSSLDKYFQELQVTSKCRDECDIAVYYQLKGAGDPTDTDNWTLLGRCAQNDVISGNYPDEHLDIFPIEKASERIRFKFLLSSTDDDFSPILYGEGGGIQLISRIAGTIMQVDMTLKVGDRISNSSSAMPHMNVSQQIESLEMLKSSIAPLTFTGLDGVERKVLFRRPGIKERPYVIGKSQNEWRVDCSLQEAE